MAKKSKESILAEYKQKCGSFQIEYDKDDGKTYIYTERFRAEPLYTEAGLFDNFSDSIQSLYELTFGNPTVMEKFATGQINTKEEFKEKVLSHTQRWNNHYPFAGFVVKALSTDDVIGFEVLGNGSKPNVGETAYLFRADSHRSEKQQYVGYENVGALIWGYGAELYEYKAHVNQQYDQDTKIFMNGSVFTTVSATARIDNPASVKILQNLGFSEVSKTNKFGHERYEFELNYEDILSHQVECGGAAAHEIAD